MPNFSAQCVKGVQGIGYVCAFLLSLCICVPMSMHQDQFKGHCLLFSTGIWQEKDGQFIVSWASQAYCNFTIFVAVIMFVISLFQFLRFLKFFYKGRDSTFISAFVDVIACAFMAIMTLTAALFVTLGFKVWCEQITKRFENCSDAVGSNAIDKEDAIDTSDFFNQMFTAQFGIWTSFTVWFTLLVFSVVKLCRYHHEENLRVSMAKGRERLINEDLISEVPPAMSGGAGGNMGGNIVGGIVVASGTTTPGATGAMQRHRRRFHVRGRTAAAASQAAQAAAEINAAHAAGGMTAAVANEANASQEDVVVIQQQGQLSSVPQQLPPQQLSQSEVEGHSGPFNDENAVAQDALYDVQVQKQIQRRLDADGSIDRSSNHSRQSRGQASSIVGGGSNSVAEAAAAAVGGSGQGPSSFSYNSDLDRYSNSSFGSSQASSTQHTPQIQGNQLRVDTTSDMTGNPWK